MSNEDLTPFLPLHGMLRYDSGLEIWSTGRGPATGVMWGVSGGQEVTGEGFEPEAGIGFEILAPGGAGDAVDQVV